MIQECQSKWWVGGILNRWSEKEGLVEKLMFAGRLEADERVSHAGEGSTFQAGVMVKVKAPRQQCASEAWGQGGWEETKGEQSNRSRSWRDEGRDHGRHPIIMWCVFCLGEKGVMQAEEWHKKYSCYHQFLSLGHVVKKVAAGNRQSWNQTSMRLTSRTWDTRQWVAL